MSNRLSRSMRDALQSTPPEDGMSFRQIALEYPHREATIRNRIRAGELAAGLDDEGHISVSRGHLVREFGASSLVPPDGKPFNVLSKKLEVPGTTLAAWSTWDPHPALGRKARSGIGPYFVPRNGSGFWRYDLKLMSEADAKECVRVLKGRVEGVEILGNPGVWIWIEKSAKVGSEAFGVTLGIFQHETEGQCFTLAYVERKCGINRSLASRSKKLVSFEVTLPGYGGRSRRPWGIEVFTEKSVNLVIERRMNRTDKRDWQVSNEIWRDSDGTWYSSSRVATLLGISLAEVSVRRTNGTFTKFKQVPRQHLDAQKNAGGTPDILVHHESDIHPLLGIPYQSQAAVAGSAFKDVDSAPTTGADLPTAEKKVVIVGTRVTIGGSEKKLRKAGFDCVKALYNAGPSGLTKDQLDIKSGHSEARKILSLLKRSDADWHEVIVFPGVNAAGGYRLRM
jgi:hypothetical protein